MKLLLAHPCGFEREFGRYEHLVSGREYWGVRDPVTDTTELFPDYHSGQDFVDALIVHEGYYIRGLRER